MQAAPVEKATPPKEGASSKKRRAPEEDGDKEKVKVAMLSKKERSQNLKTDFPDPKDRTAFLKACGVPDELIPSGEFSGGQHSYTVKSASGAAVEVQVRSGAFFAKRSAGEEKFTGKQSFSWGSGAESVWKELREKLKWA